MISYTYKDENASVYDMQNKHCFSIMFVKNVNNKHIDS